MTNYARANTKAQWFQDSYPGADMNLSEATTVLVLHTTEGSSWPGYSGGAEAPTYTARKAPLRRKLQWRAHFPDEKSARALVNSAGGVETNTANCIQVELVGSCNPATPNWGIYWPKAPDWALRELARFVVDMHKRHGLQLVAPKRFRPYPASYGSNGVRMSFAEWRSAVGIVGHQHVPENVHGDPGAIDVAKVLQFAQELLAAEAPAPAPAKVSAPPSGPRTRGKVIDSVLHSLRGAKGKGHRAQAISDALKSLRSIRPWRKTK